jgi:hypothetical protein
MAAFVQNLLIGYKLPDERALKKILCAMTEAQLKQQMQLISAVKNKGKGGAVFGLQLDLWSKRKIRESFVSVHLTFVVEHPITKKREFQDMLLKFGHFPKIRHTGKAIARWLLNALAAVGLSTTDIVLATPDGASNGLKALRMMHVVYDICVEHQLDRIVSHATGLASKKGAENPDCYALIKANRKMAAKILTSSQLQEGLRKNQRELGIAKTETLRVMKFGETRFGSGVLLIERNNDLFIPIKGLAAEELHADPDYAEAVRLDAAEDIDGIDDDADGGGWESIGDGSDLDDSDGEASDGSDGDDADLKSLNLGECMLSDEEHKESEIYEALMLPAKSAMLELQASFNTCSKVLMVFATLRRYTPHTLAHYHTCRHFHTLAHTRTLAHFHTLVSAVFLYRSNPACAGWQFVYSALYILQYYYHHHHSHSYPALYILQLSQWHILQNPTPWQRKLQRCAQEAVRNGRDTRERSPFVGKAAQQYHGHAD